MILDVRGDKKCLKSRHWTRIIFYGSNVCVCALDKCANVIFWIHCIRCFTNSVITRAFKEFLLIRISIVCNRKTITKLSSVMLIWLQWGIPHKQNLTASLMKMEQPFGLGLTCYKTQVKLRGTISECFPLAARSTSAWQELELRRCTTK